MPKFIKCPECGHVFKRPVVDRKFTGLGFSPPGMGVLRCPECKFEKRRKYFPIVGEGDTPPPSTPEAPKPIKQTSQADDIEESKFEDE